jgi:hypothetical protein
VEKETFSIAVSLTVSDRTTFSIVYRTSVHQDEQRVTSLVLPSLPPRSGIFPPSVNFLCNDVLVTSPAHGKKVRDRIILLIPLGTRTTVTETWEKFPRFSRDRRPQAGGVSLT